jgi:hypothetical protein
VDDLTTIILTRRYYTEPPDGDLEVIVSFGRPVREISGYHGCTYRFSGDHEVTRYAGGADEIDALISALEMAGTYLEHLNEHKYGGRLQWDFGSAKSSLPTISNRWPLHTQSDE